mmetsp:Transcript_54898/g.126115  ORF Transcript_54898/g.126115 Transcript_54898/m.126115 type:complete len:601 (-) Transcript_54898:596-2398(-)
MPRRGIAFRENRRYRVRDQILQSGSFSPAEYALLSHEETARVLGWGEREHDALLEMVVLELSLVQARVVWDVHVRYLSSSSFVAPDFMGERPGPFAMKRTIVCMQDFGSLGVNWTEWLAIGMALFLTTNFNVIFVEIPIITLDSIRWEAVGAQILESLLDHLNVPRPMVLGHGMGGKVFIDSVLPPGREVKDWGQTHVLLSPLVSADQLQQLDKVLREEELQLWTIWSDKPRSKTSHKVYKEGYQLMMRAQAGLERDAKKGRIVNRLGAVEYAPILMSENRGSEYRQQKLPWQTDMATLGGQRILLSSDEFILTVDTYFRRKPEATSGMIKMGSVVMDTEAHLKAVKMDPVVLPALQILNGEEPTLQELPNPRLARKKTAFALENTTSSARAGWAKAGRRVRLGVSLHDGLCDDVSPAPAEPTIRALAASASAPIIRRGALADRLVLHDRSAVIALENQPPPPDLQDELALRGTREISRAAFTEEYIRRHNAARIKSHETERVRSERVEKDEELMLATDLSEHQAKIDQLRFNEEAHLAAILRISQQDTRRAFRYVVAVEWLWPIVLSQSASKAGSFRSAATRLWCKDAGSRLLGNLEAL